MAPGEARSATGVQGRAQSQAQPGSHAGSSHARGLPALRMQQLAICCSQACVSAEQAMLDPWPAFKQPMPDSAPA